MNKAIPSDVEIVAMGAAELYELCDGYRRAGDEGALEAVSDALLWKNKGWLAGAHPEGSDTRRCWRIKREIAVERGGENWVFQNIDEMEIQSMLTRAAAAGLTERQAEVWMLSFSGGYSEEAIGELLGINQESVSRALNRARANLWDHLDKNGDWWWTFWRESHRSAYFAVPMREALSDDLEAARRLLESEPDVLTLIYPEDPSKIAIWKNEEPTGKELTEREVMGEAKWKLFPGLLMAAVLRRAASGQSPAKHR